MRSVLLARSPRAAASAVSPRRSSPREPPVAEQLDDEEVGRALAAGDYEAALQILLVRAADPAQREEARRVMVALFGELGQDHPLSTQYRKQLATLMF